MAAETTSQSLGPKPQAEEAASYTDRPVSVTSGFRGLYPLIIMVLQQHQVDFQLVQEGERCL